MQRKVKVDRRKSASSVKADIESELGIIISEQAVRSRSHEIGFKGRVARKEPYMDKTTRIERAEYARKYREKPSDFWNHILWTDESRFNLCGSDGKVMMWRAPKEI